MSAAHDHSNWTIRALARAVRNKELTFTEIADMAISKRSELLGAYRHHDDELVSSRAAIADEQLASGIDRGPLMGLPVSVKDLYGVPGFPTCAGSPMELPERFTQAGPVVTTLLDQGAVITGKTHTVEFAFGGLGTNPHLPTPRNPWDPHVHRVPGGSSSGAGVSLVEGSAVLALGTDTAGSVRIPAAMTGRVGLKTTAKRWSQEGIVPLSTTLDTAGVLTNDVEDAIIAFAEIDPNFSSVQAFENEMGSRKIEDLSFAHCDRLFWDDLSPGVGEAVEASLKELEHQGATRTAIDLPAVEPTYELFKEGGPVGVELYRFLSTELPEWFDTLDPNVRARVGNAGELTESQYQDRLLHMTQWGSEVAVQLEPVDVLVCPTVANTPPALDDIATPAEYGPQNLLSLRNTSIANYLGMCALTLPVGLDDAGMPVGLMIMAAAGRETRLLAVAREMERVLGTSRERIGVAPLGP